MPSPENRIWTKWAREQRQADLAWIRENTEIFHLAAGIAFRGIGRGAIADMSVQPSEVECRENPAC